MTSTHFILIIRVVALCLQITISNDLASQRVAKHTDFTRSGLADLGTGSLRATGYGNYTWTRTAYNDTVNAYHLHIDSANSYLSLHYARWLSYIIRCLAR